MSMIERPLPYFTRIAYPVLRRLVLEHGRAHLWGYALAFVFMALVAASTTYSAYLLKSIINGLMIERDFRGLRILAFTIAGLYLVKAGAQALGGRGGGGRRDLAQAGGPDGSKAEAAIEAIEAAIPAAA